VQPGALPTPPPQSFRQRASTRAILGLFLLAAIVGGAGGLIFVATGGGVEDTLDVTASAASRLPQRMVALSLCGIMNAGSAVGMWSFRRWGVYGVVCASLVAFVINWKVGGVPVALPGLIAVGLVAVFAMAVWVEFD
jgi:hypothetical protein